MPKRGYVTRKTEEYALQPSLVNRVQTDFIAPYGSVSFEIKKRLEQDRKDSYRGEIDREANQKFGWLNNYVELPHGETSKPEQLTDSQIVDKAGVWKNERHSRMMERDFLAPHEKRCMGEFWQSQEATDYQDQLESLKAQKAANLSAAEANNKFGYLNKYIGSVLVEITPEFESMNFDDSEIIPENSTSAMSPIFTSTGKTFASKRKHNEHMSPFGDEGIRKEISQWATRACIIQEFTPVKVTIPDYVEREDWLAYCLKKII